MYNRLVEGLFETKALRISPEDKPFWYTSGKLGPFYINTHFLYGSEEKATNLLKIIDDGKSDSKTLHQTLFKEIMSNYENDAIFHSLINDMVSYIKDNIDMREISYISGGERRDWFFSMPVAELLKIKHITIFKDLSMAVCQGGELCDENALKNVSGSKVLHIADLITEASSYERAWVPAIKYLGAEISHSLVVIDRNQGGKELLEKLNVKSHALCGIDYKLFVKALELGCINKAQYAMVNEYLENPDGAMKNFIKTHPGFLEGELNSDEKTAQRAKLCIEKGFYN